MSKTTTLLRKSRILVSALKVLLLTSLAAGPAAAQAADRYEIRLVSGAFTPVEGVPQETASRLAAKAGGRPAHLLVQLREVPTAATRATLAASGLELLGYVSGNAWLATLAPDKAATALVRPEVRWAIAWDATRKIHPRLADPTTRLAARDVALPDPLRLFVHLHDDVSLEAAKDLASALGGEALAPVAGLHGFGLRLPEGRLSELAEREEVKWVGEADLRLSPTNDGILGQMRVEPLTQPPYGLDGSGVRILVYDAGWAQEDHPTFSNSQGDSRVTVIDDFGVNALHATHVAGTVAGNGAYSEGGNGRGVAPDARILSAALDPPWNSFAFIDDNLDVEQDYVTAFARRGADLATNSVGSNVAANGWDCAYEGDYTLTAELVDGIVRGDQPEIGAPAIVVWSAGNERGPGTCGANFGTIAPPACAKNPIHVGAINSDGGSMTLFSSWGPCDDGRLKPTVMAPGCEAGVLLDGEKGIYSSVLDGDYSEVAVECVLDLCSEVPICGTSMAAPAVAGTVALLVEDWRARGHGTRGEQPLPALVKAMLIHTARDQGPHGPDFLYGFGEVDARALIDLLRADNGVLGDGGGSQWGAGEVGQDELREYEIQVPAAARELVASLAWDDPAAEPFVGGLVHDLDLELVAPDGTLHRPWVLDPTEGFRHLPAVPGTNTLDNQEQASVEDPVAGTWRVRVRGSRVTTRFQTFGLAYSVRTASFEGTCITDRSDFEERTPDWTLTGYVEVADEPQPGAANQALHLFYWGEAAKTFHVPFDSAKAEWRYAFRMTTEPWAAESYRDELRAEVRDPATHETLAVLELHDSGWPQDVWMQTLHLDLGPWRGQTVELAFVTGYFFGNPTEFWIDDVEVETCEWSLGLP